MITSRRRDEPGVLLEREDVLAAAERNLRHAAGGVGSSLVLSGPPGIGKTRALDAVVGLVREQGFQLLRARGAETEAAFPFAAALQLLERHIGAQSSGASLMTGAAALAQPVLEGRFLHGEGGPVASAVHGLFWLTVNLSAQGPVALLVDDLHALDEQTLGYLLYLHRRIDQLPVALIAASRQPELQGRSALSELVMAPGVDEIQLRPLSSAGVTELVRREFDPLADDEFCEACLRVSGGNPFYLEEALRELTAEGTSGNHQGTRRLSDVEPQAVARAVLLRLARLGPEAIALAQAAAVVGSGIDVGLAAELAELDMGPALTAADNLLRAAILSSISPLTFVHSLVAAAIAGDIPPGQNRALHLRAAELLSARHAPVERVAVHVLQAPPAGRQTFLDVLAAAAGHAQDAGAPDIAAAYLRRALEEPPATPDAQIALLLALGRAEVSTNPDAASAHLEEARSLGAGERSAAELALGLGRALYVAGQHARAARTFLDAAERLPGDDPLVRELWAWFISASVFVESLRPRALELLGQMAVEPPAQPTPAERAVLAQAAVQHVAAGNPLREVEHLARLSWGDGQLLREETSDGYSWMHITAIYLWGGGYREAERIVDLVLADARGRGSVMAFATASYIKASAESYQGRLLDCLADFEQTLEIHRRYGWSMFIGAARSVHALALLERGEVEAAADTLAPVLDDPRFEASSEAAMIHYAQGCLELARGNAAGAITALSATRARTDRLAIQPIPLLPIWLPMGQALARQGRREQALAELADGEAAARRAEIPEVVAAILVARAGLEQGEEALQTLRQAIASAESGQSQLEVARAQVALGTRLRRAGQRSEAVEPLRSALDLAHRAGALPLEKLAREELAVLGSRPRRAHLSGVESLTVSELRTARLAASGITNREIAEALFVTPKTVEYHLRNVFMKLDLASRAELAQALGDAPD